MRNPFVPADSWRSPRTAGVWRWPGRLGCRSGTLAQDNGSARCLAATHPTTRWPFLPMAVGWQRAAGGCGGRTLAAGLRDEEPVWRVRDLSSRELVFSPDSRMVAIVSPDRNEVALLAVATGDRQGPIPAKACWSAEFSPDGRWLAIAAETGLLLWDWPTARSPGPRRTPRAPVAFSPDSHRLAAARHDGTIGLWDGELGRLLHTLGTAGPLRPLRFVGTDRLIVADHPAGFQVWHATLGERPAAPAVRRRGAGVCLGRLSRRALPGWSPGYRRRWNSWISPGRDFGPQRREIPEGEPFREFSIFCRPTAARLAIRLTDRCRPERILAGGPR